jgi:predicted nucleic acid-binding protein
MRLEPRSKGGKGDTQGTKRQAALEEKGAMIGFYDVIVAATALERNWPVASFSVRHFRSVDGPKVIEPTAEASL